VKAQFIGPRKFCRYNMFNHYFFGGDASRNTYFQFLSKCSSRDAVDILVVMDPPFGGHVAVLAHTMQCIAGDYETTRYTCVFIIVPYSCVLHFCLTHLYTPFSRVTCDNLLWLMRSAEFQNRSSVSSLSIVIL